MRYAGYDAVTIGEREMNYGLDFLIEEMKQGKFKVVSANLRDKSDSALVFEPYVIETIGGVKIGLLGLLDDDARIVGVFEQLERAYVSSYIEAAREYLPQLKKDADLVIALAHIGLGKARQLAETVPDFDVILVGHGGDRTSSAEKVGETIISKAGSKSSSIGTLLLALDDAGKIVAFDGNVQTLKKPGRKNPDVTRIVTECEKRDKARDRLLSARRYKLPVIPDRPEVVSAKGYLGWETCKQCHSQIHERWSTEPHARAFATLAEGDRWNDPSCLPCHTTGYEVAARTDSADVRPEMWNVQCEACHGMGTQHERGAVMKPVPESVCLRCHTPEWSPDWDYEEALKKIDHGKDGTID